MLRPRSALLPLVLATAAFSECGGHPVTMILEGPELVDAVRVDGGPALRCDPARLTARLGGTGEGTRVVLTGGQIVVTDLVDHAPLWQRRQTAEEAAELWGAAELGRVGALSAEVAVEVPRAAWVSVVLSYRVEGAGSATGPSAPAGFTFRCNDYAD